MIQAIGLTSAARRSAPPAVEDLTFEARPGHVTVLLGAAGAGKTTALRLMLQLQPGRGVALIRGRPLHRIPHPPREVGVLLGDVPGHPARSVRGHLRMLAAAAGVSTGRADTVLELVGLSGLAYHRLGSLSLGMDRRLGLAAALLGDPHTLVLDEPLLSLSPRESAWVRGLLRSYAAQGGAVLVTTPDPLEATRVADRVVTIDGGRLVADQSAADFSRTRLRPRVAVRSPHADRLAALLSDGKRRGGPVEVVRESRARISVYGSSCAAVGETAFRHGILVHQLADEIGDTGPVPPLDRADGRPVTPEPRTAATASAHRGSTAVPPEAGGSFPRAAPPGPAWPLRYELRRAGGVRTGWLAAGATLAASLLASALAARAGETSAARLLAGWPVELPLPPTAFGAALLGALAFGQEFRYPVLGYAHTPVPRRLGLLLAKLAVCTAAAVVLALVSVVLNETALRLIFGAEAAVLPADWPVAFAGWAGLVTGCACAGLLAAGLFRSTAMGLAVVLAGPVAAVPAVRALLARPDSRPLAGLPGWLRTGGPARWPSGLDGWISGVLRLVSQPVGRALALSLCLLLCAYLMTVLHRKAR
ncbi:ABC transporter ATP-binding protein [Streptomyces sp. KR80]|uniref:ABC transporter ATP-binding protein n=1 Tax=Streptomyces sp. KR80 TaxID=3457426 RepID=UPI003FD35225